MGPSTDIDGQAQGIRNKMKKKLSFSLRPDSHWRISEESYYIAHVIFFRNQDCILINN